MNVVITFLVLPYSLKYFQVQIQLVQSRNYAADSWTENALFGEGLGVCLGVTESGRMLIWFSQGLSVSFKGEL